MGATPGPEPSRLGRYHVEALIGRGAMGAVYRGSDVLTGRTVALKTLALAREFDGDALAEARARFTREAATAARLRHPDIVAVYESGEHQGLAYIAMEFVAGHDLQAHTLPGRLLAPARVVSIVVRVAEALAHAHRQGVVHRDVKPANVMVEPASDVVKLGDFGVAQITNAARTRTGMLLGTPSYMSPEQLAGARIDGRSDLYSLGVMLYQLLTGALPHASESMADLMRAIANEPAADVRGLRPELPEALARCVARALEKRPETRHADAGQLAAELRGVN
jgi:eukaryotic-like serine/threonine-protein kinase